MYCLKCGARYEEGSKFCVECGSPIPREEKVSVEEGNMQPSPIERVIEVERFNKWRVPAILASYITPLIGLIFYLVWKEDKSVLAKECGESALISVICSLVLVFGYILFILALVIGSLGNTPFTMII